MPWEMKTGDQQVTRWQAGIDLADATDIVFLASRVCGGTAEINKAGSLDPTDSTIVEVLIESSESTPAGKLFVEIEATFPDGQKITLPDDGYESLIFKKDQGPPPP